MNIENIELITNIFAVLLVCQLFLIAIFTLMKNKIDKLGKTIHWMIWLSVVAMWLFNFKCLAEDVYVSLGTTFYLILVAMSFLYYIFSDLQRKREKEIEKNK